MRTNPLRRGRRLRSRIASLLAAGLVLALGGNAWAGPPQGGGFSIRGGGMPGLNLPFKSNGNGLANPIRQAPSLGALVNKAPIAIPRVLAGGVNGPAGPIRSLKGNKGAGDKGGGKGVGIAIASQVLQNLVSQLGAGGFGGGGGGGGGSSGGFDAGSAGGYETPPVPVAQAEASEPAASPPPTGNTTALQITELGRGAAARAGLQNGDIILKVDGKRTKTFEDLQVLLGGSSGKSQFLIVNSDDGKLETRELSVQNGRIGATVVVIPIDLDEAEPKPAPTPPAATPQTALQVTDVRPGNAAAAGIQVKNVIVGVDGKRVSTADEFVAALKASKGTSTIAVYDTDKEKLETKTMAVEDGKIGLSVKQVPIAVE